MKDSKRPCELASLDTLNTKNGVSKLYLSGVLREGSTRYFVKDVPFQEFFIEGYFDEELTDLRSGVTIRSIAARRDRQEIYYRLSCAAPEYAHHFDSFLWLATFSKFFIDFIDRHKRATLQSFRSDFYRWLVNAHKGKPVFERWLSRHDGSDFRRAVNAHTSFLWQQAWNLEALDLREHVLWSEVELPGQPCSAVARLPQVVFDECRVGPDTLEFLRTIVTPYIYDLFKDLTPGCLRPVRTFLSDQRKIAPSVGKIRRRSSTDLENHLAQNIASVATPEAARDASGRTQSGSLFEKFVDRVLQPGKQKYQVGEVVVVESDLSGGWQNPSKYWLGYVQKVKEVERSRQQRLFLIWLYEPRDTTCGTMRYPYINEVFFSDNCNCGDESVYASQVLGVVPAYLFTDPDAVGEDAFCIRQRFVSTAHCFRTLQSTNLCCLHHRGLRRRDPAIASYEAYPPGTTVLVKASSRHQQRLLEPVEVINLRQLDDTVRVRVRHLRRRCSDFEGQEYVAPNELVYTEDYSVITASQIERKCLIRFYDESESLSKSIPPPYSRDGAADAFFITQRASKGNSGPSLIPLCRPFPESLIQGFDPAQPPVKPKLRGMDLFCGGGNFGRGLAEGGAVEHRWAVDFWSPAIHTYRANLGEHEDDVTCLGSVNDYLKLAMDGKCSKTVARQGEVDFISAGSPCQGFSNANNNKNGQRAHQQRSMLASVLSFIDFYRPKYALLENVPDVAAMGRTMQHRNYFCQFICALAGMGYQADQFILNAWNYGGATSRKRLFISITAAGLTPIERPRHSHSHPPWVGDRRIGISSNGIGFGGLSHDPTPFQYLTAESVVRDLPDIGYARMPISLPYPDHRPLKDENADRARMIGLVPRFEYEMTFIKTMARNLIPPPLFDCFRWQCGHRGKPESRSYARLRGSALFPTITTAANPECAYTGRVLHWDQPRLITVQEVRRAMGYPDDEVLIGCPRDQYKIVGNSVSRQVALALGLAIREAWLQSADLAPPPSPSAFSVQINPRSQLDSPAPRGCKRPLSDAESDERGSPSRRVRLTVDDRKESTPVDTEALQSLTVSCTIDLITDDELATSPAQPSLRSSRRRRISSTSPAPPTTQQIKREFPDKTMTRLSNDHELFSLDHQELLLSPSRTRRLHRGLRQPSKSRECIIISDDEYEPSLSQLAAILDAVGVEQPIRDAAVISLKDRIESMIEDGELVDDEDVEEQVELLLDEESGDDEGEDLDDEPDDEHKAEGDDRGVLMDFNMEFDDKRPDSAMSVEDSVVGKEG